MDKLQWFKFAPADWMMGKIIRCPEITQARFLRLCCLYWNKETNLTEEDARIEVDDEHFEILLKKKIISSNDEHIFIDFLDEQFYKILETSKQASKAGKASAEKRRQNAEQKLNDRSTTVQQIPTDKIREEKKREEKTFKEKVNGFIEWFNDKKKEHTGTIGKFKTLSTTDEKNLKRLLKDYDFKDFGKAIPNMFKNAWAKETNNQTPAHFLRVDNFNKYLNIEPTKPKESSHYKNDFRPKLDSKGFQIIEKL